MVAHWRILGRVSLSMFMLYAGKASGILVNLFFIPIYSGTLGPELFGMVAVILSIQALLMMLDLGMSTIVGRDVAANEQSPGELLQETFSAEFVLVFMYAILVCVLGASFILDFRLGLLPGVAITIALMFMLMVLQNLYCSAIVARQEFFKAGALQLTGSLLRAGGTAYVLLYVSPTLSGFVWAQFAGALLQAAASRYLCIHGFKKNPHYLVVVSINSIWKRASSLFRHARPLALMSASGALVSQLDKPIISIFMSASSVAPYFLAMTFCMVPIGVLATPIAQYFQPLIINAVADGNNNSSSAIMHVFTVTIAVVVILLSTIMYIYSDFLVGAWLHHGILVGETLVFVRVLLPGLAIGALGYIPYSLLLAIRDYKFMAALSATLMVLTLCFVAVASNNQSIYYVCVIYVVFHVGTTLLQWFRAVTSPEVGELARSSAKLTTVTILAAVLVLTFFKLIELI